jgi:predicted alpha/beta-hydrolase family hydrolase
MAAAPDTPDTPLAIDLGDGTAVSGLVDAPAARTEAWCVLAHGAGAGMRHDFMARLAAGLAARGIAVLRYQFPFIERGSRRPDPPAVAQAAVRAAVAEARRRAAGLPLFAGGKSFGGRMTTQAHAAEPLPGVDGLLLVGFPLHPAGKPSVVRAEHLAPIRTPMLFLQGTRDALADPTLIRQVVSRHPGPIDLELVPDADHAFHVPARSGRGDAAILESLLDTMAGWMRSRRP